MTVKQSPSARVSETEGKTGADKTSAPRPGRNAGGRLRSFQGIVGATAFAVLLAGSNATNPLLPLYRETLGLSPLMITLTFVSYVGALIIGLLALSRPSLMKAAPLLLCSALLIAIAADVMLSMATETGILLGRMLTGVAGALGTGSASALVVAALGARGRAISATGNLVGAVLGTGFSQMAVSLIGSRAMHWAPEGHAAICVAVLALLALILLARRSAHRSELVMPKGPVEAGALRRQVARHIVPISVGCLSWATLSLAVVWVPSYFGEVGLTFVRNAGLVVFLVFSALGQIMSPFLARRLPAMSGVLSLAVGIALALLAARLHLSALALAGLGLLGLGTGVAYRLALVVLTRGASPAQQGSLASLYAAITYGVAAATILLSGFVGNAVGLQDAVVGLFCSVLVLALVLVRPAPRLRQSIA